MGRLRQGRKKSQHLGVYPRSPLSVEQQGAAALMRWLLSFGSGRLGEGSINSSPCLSFPWEALAVSEKALRLLGRSRASCLEE